MSDEIKETIRILSHEDAEQTLYERGGELGTPAGTVQVVVRHLEAMPPILRHSWRFRGSGNALWPVAPVANGRDLIAAIYEATNAHVNNTGRTGARPSEMELRRLIGVRTAERDEARAHLRIAGAERDEARGLLAQNEAAMDKILAERDSFHDRIDEIADALGDETEWSNCNDRGARALELANESDAALRDARSRLDQAARLLGERTAERDEARKELEARRAADGMVGERNVVIERRLAQAERAENGNEVLAGALDNLRKELGAGAEESTASAVLRVVRERDTALRDFEAERKRAAAAIDYDAKVREALGAKPEESTDAATRRLVDALGLSRHREDILQRALDAIRHRLAAGDSETATAAVERVLLSHASALEAAKTALRDQIEASGKTIGRLGGELAAAEGQVTRIAEAVNADADELAIEAVQRLVTERNDMSAARTELRAVIASPVPESTLDAVKRVVRDGERYKRANDELAEKIDSLIKIGDEKAIAIARLKADHQGVIRVLDAKLRAAVSGSDLAASVAPSIEALADAVLSRLTGEIDRLGQRAAQLSLTSDNLKAELAQHRGAHVKLHEEMHNLQVAATAQAQSMEAALNEAVKHENAAAGAEARAAKLEAEVVTAIRQRDGLDADLSAEQRKREQAEEKVTALTKGIGRAQSDQAKTEQRLAELGSRYDDLVSRIGAALASAAMVGRDVFSKGADRG